MKCLSVQQPWAWAIIHGPKRIENRSRPFSHRGPLLIHAGKSRIQLGNYGEGEPPESQLVFGAIIGIVDVIGCTDFVDLENRFAEGPFCLLLENPRALANPIPWKGQLGLFEVPDALFLENLNDDPAIFMA